jgi:DNA polymerase III delta subunit
MPEAEAKAEGWALITGNNSTLSKKMIEEIIFGFNQPNQLDLTDQYLNEKYFSQLY